MAHTRTSRRRKKQQQLDPRWIVAGAVLLIAAAVVLIIATREDPTTNAADNNVVLAQDFTLPTFAGQQVSLSDFRGQVVLLNFWAWWCPPCKAEMPDLHQFYLDYKDQGFTILAVHADQEAQKGADFIADNGFTFPVVQDTTGSAFYIYGDGSLPQSVLIGPSGELIKTYRAGMITSEMLAQDVLPLLRG
jgi:peroxiredoxin